MFYKPFRILTNHTGVLKRANFGEQRVPESYYCWNNATYMCEERRLLSDKKVLAHTRSGTLSDKDRFQVTSP